MIDLLGVKEGVAETFWDGGTGGGRRGGAYGSKRGRWLFPLTEGKTGFEPEAEYRLLDDPGG